MFNIDRILSTLQNDKGVRNSALSGAAGMLAGGGGKKFMGSAVKMGAVAAIGGLAYKAWQAHQQTQASPGQSGAPLSHTTRAAFIPGPGQENEEEELGKTLVRAMITAAKADGKIDADERDAIFAKLSTMDLGPEEKAFVFDELASPLDMTALLARADTPEHATEIYAASLVAIEADTEGERAYLKDLAHHLKLDYGLVTEIHRHAGVAPPAPLEPSGFGGFRSLPT